MKPKPWTPERIRQLRESRGMTQSEFAVAIDLSSPTSVSRLEHGGCKPGRRTRKELDALEKKN